MTYFFTLKVIKLNFQDIPHNSFPNILKNQRKKKGKRKLEEVISLLITKTKWVF